MNTLDRIASTLKRNPDLLEPLAGLLELVDRSAATPPDSWRLAERELLDAARHLSCAAQQAVLQAFDSDAPEPFVHQGRRFEPTRRASKTYVGLDGPLRVCRWLYHDQEGL